MSTRLISFLFVALLALGLASCEKEQNAAMDEIPVATPSAMEGAVEEATEAVEEAVDTTEEAVEAAGEAVEEAVEAAEEAVQEVEEAAEEVAK